MFVVDSASYARTSAHFAHILSLCILLSAFSTTLRGEEKNFWQKMPTRAKRKKNHYNCVFVGKQQKKARSAKDRSMDRPTTWTDQSA